MEDKFEQLFTERPCISCVFFKTCGDLLRTEKCEEHMTQSQYMSLGQKKKEEIFYD